MAYITPIGTNSYFNADVSQGIPDGQVLTTIPIPENPVWDDEVQNIREKNAAELLADDQESLINDLRYEALRRANLVYGDEVFQTIGAVKLLLDIENTYDRSGPVAPRLLAVNQLLTKYEAAVLVIKELDQAGVDTYDVSTDPGWP